MRWNIFFQECVTSSMEAFGPDSAACAEGSVVVAARQDCGRGRQGKLWISPCGGLYCSLFLRPGWAVSDLSKMPLLSAVAVAEAVRQTSGLSAWIKWPNDILIDEKKVAGILTESQIQGQSAGHVVVGIGVNVNSGPPDLPEGAVSMKGMTGRDYNLDFFLDAVLERFGFWYDDAGQNGFSGMLERWRQMCGLFGRRVRVEQGGGFYEGIVTDLADDGGLLIQTDDGRVSKIVSAEGISLKVGQKKQA